MKIIFIGLIALALSLALAFAEEGSVTFRNDGSGALPLALTCTMNTDCVPLPFCHPHACIPKTALSLFPPAPQACTLIFDPEAAYSPEDCECRNTICYNKNLERTLSESEGSTAPVTQESSSAQ